MDCGEDNSSNYLLECGGGQCTTDTWPVCDDDTTEEILKNSLDTTWEYTACQEVDIDYLNKTVSCGKDGWKTGKLVTMVGQGVFRTCSLSRLSSGDVSMVSLGNIWQAEH